MYSYIHVYICYIHIYIYMLYLFFLLFGGVDAVDYYTLRNNHLTHPFILISYPKSHL